MILLWYTYLYIYAMVQLVGTTTSFIIVIIQSYRVPDRIGLVNHDDTLFYAKASFN